MSLIAAVYNAVIGLRKRTWASGMTVRKNEIVKSPADNEDYERITATGGGTTDPADDITNYVARSYVRTAALPGGGSVGSAIGGIIANIYEGSTRSTIATTTVGTRVNALSISGRGSIDFFAYSKNAGGSARVEIIADGRTLLDETVATSSLSTLLYIGGAQYGGASKSEQALPVRDGLVFKRSFAVYVTAVSTAAGTGGGIAYIARGEA